MEKEEESNNKEGKGRTRPREYPDDEQVEEEEKEEEEKESKRDEASASKLGRSRRWLMPRKLLLISLPLLSLDLPRCFHCLCRAIVKKTSPFLFFPSNFPFDRKKI